MTLDERLDTVRGLEPVPETEVVRYWLGEEVDDESDWKDDELLDPDTIDTEPALREELLERKPIASRVFGAEPAEWYHADLSEEELRDLRVVVGPHDEDWRALAEDNRVGTIAERIYEVETDDGTTGKTDETTSVAELDAESPKDLREVVKMADAIDPEGRKVGSSSPGRATTRPTSRTVTTGRWRTSCIFCGVGSSRGRRRIWGFRIRWDS
jgi:hypothetical protein